MNRPEPIRHAERVVAIVGAGRMGADIALAFARGGWRCEVVETDRRRAAEAGKHWTRECRRLRKFTRLLESSLRRIKRIGEPMEF